MNAALTWGGAGVTSVAAHLGVALLIAAMVQPHPIADQPQPKSELRIETEQVARSQATPQQPNAPQAAAASAKGSELSQGTVPQSRARATPPPQDRLTPPPAAAPSKPAPPP